MAQEKPSPISRPKMLKIGITTALRVPYKPGQNPAKTRPEAAKTRLGPANARPGPGQTLPPQRSQTILSPIARAFPPVIFPNGKLRVSMAQKIKGKKQPRQHQNVQPGREKKMKPKPEAETPHHVG